VNVDVGGLRPNYNVVLVWSPPVNPEYNDNCEAGIGTLKVRTHHEAACHGRVGIWTSEDVEVARRHACEFHYPHGHAQPNASDLWQSRAPIRYTKRAQLKLALERASWEIQEKRNDTPEEQFTVTQQATEHRRRGRRILRELGIVTVTWTSIASPNKSRNRAEIS
jgi:hypothetical protein